MSTMHKMITIKGLGCIKATIIKDSISMGDRFTTFELEYPRFCHQEVMTHCMLEKNAASSRAIPVEAMLKTIELNPAAPIKWGSNNPGMQSKTELEGDKKDRAIAMWNHAATAAIHSARRISDKEGVNVHKQIANRITEPFQVMKTVISGTEWVNFFWLRNHPDAQPEFQELARVMWECMQESNPVELKPGEWHLPYVDTVVNGRYVAPDDLDLAKKTSASCCAQVQYRKLNDSAEKAEKVFDMLNLESETTPAHASPICHQATPMQEQSSQVNIPRDFDTWEPGVTHVRRNGSLWSGKLQGWVQYRQLFENEARW